MPDYQLILRSGSRKGASWTLGDKPLVVGRDLDCDIVLQDQLVSRRHCEIGLEGEQVRLRDLESSNCTLVNGRPVSDCPLNVGDEIGVGSNTLLLTSRARASLQGQSPGRGTGDTKRVGAYWERLETPGRAVAGLPCNVADLARLVETLNAFSVAENTTDLVHALEDAINQRFAPARCWMALCQKQQLDYVVWPRGRKPTTPKDPVLELMAAAIESNQPCQQVRRTLPDELSLYQALIAPIAHGQHRIGIVMIEVALDKRQFDEADVQFAVALLRGAAPFFSAIERRRQLERNVQRFQVERQRTLAFVGSGEAAKKLLYLLRLVARSDEPVLIAGETGSGKELVAQLIHEQSERKDGPFVAMNCAAIPGELFESELFGHEKGAFTGAVQRRIGLLEQANTGTLFLDEVGEMTPAHQARLLRAIELHQYRRVGGEKEHNSDFRVVAATNRDLGKLAAGGGFREDLYHRLKGLQVQVPALRERPEDIPELAAHFLGEALRDAKRPVRGFSDAALELLARHPWPGNVRELRRTVRTAVALSTEDQIDETLLGMLLGGVSIDRAPKTLEQVEREAIVQALAYCKGNVPEAARLLGIGRSTLYTKVTAYNIDLRP